ncbi:hypothetical protein [Spiroplasma phoeniceum]|uniref:Uncharacterized protein n=1 Tax=Spiroplasma phoeniceum P40 TaxID=1276259 RepID=A0A345DN47_9MOLU|nr:hypothetical protein [Spiroplasma phoeniceum]AXF95635.1 hypothetical protein SDAV_00644 [Spiroplasma phoeniceum P40]
MIKKNKIKKITMYSVIKYHKLHYSSFHNHFFDEKNNELTLKKGINLITKTFDNEFIKTRPAIVIGTMGQSLLIVPTSTKKSINKNIQNFFRTKINLNGKDTYICWEQTNHIYNSQITGFWFEDGKLYLILFLQIIYYIPILKRYG